MIGIFRLECMETGSNYVKQSFHVEKDLESTLDALRKGNHKNPSLQKEWTEYGEEQFDVGIPETLTFDAVTSRSEQEAALQEALDEWMDILEDVEVLES